MKILLGTKNKGKLKEFKEIFEKEFSDLEIITLNDLFDVEEPVEDGLTFYENAVIKAKYYYEAYKMPVICDDTGLVIEALDGRPGVFSARYSGDHNFEANIDKVLMEMEGKENRKAYFQTCMVYYDGNELIFADGYCHGEILKERHGERGFGYDAIFYVSGLNKSFGQMTEEEKNSISHRYNAIKNLLNKLKMDK